jgi:ATP-dependent DNA ligase
VTNDGFLYPMRPVVPRVLPPTPADFLIQPKYDGWNVVVSEGRIWTRRGKEITAWTGDWGFDPAPSHPINGELLAVAGDTVVGHADIQGIRTGRRRARLVAFDVMVEGPGLEERLEMLRDAVGTGMHIAPTTDLGPTGTWPQTNRELDEALAAGHEGLMLKRRGSLYHPGRHAGIVTHDWLKMKAPAGPAV